MIRISKKAEVPTEQLEKDLESMSKKELQALEKQLQKKMTTAAAELNFELAAQLRDELFAVKQQLLAF